MIRVTRVLGPTAKAVVLEGYLYPALSQNRRSHLLSALLYLNDDNDANRDFILEFDPTCTSATCRWNLSSPAPLHTIER
jgi:hypothetical protein